MLYVDETCFENNRKFMHMVLENIKQNRQTFRNMYALSKYLKVTAPFVFIFRLAGYFCHNEQEIMSSHEKHMQQICELFDALHASASKPCVDESERRLMVFALKALVTEMEKCKDRITDWHYQKINTTKVISDLQLMLSRCQAGNE